jgi:hypothetical protein
MCGLAIAFKNYLLGNDSPTQGVWESLGLGVFLGKLKLSPGEVLATDIIVIRPPSNPNPLPLLKRYTMRLFLCGRSDNAVAWGQQKPV